MKLLLIQKFYFAKPNIELFLFLFWRHSAFVPIINVLEKAVHSEVLEFLNITDVFSNGPLLPLAHYSQFNLCKKRSTNTHSPLVIQNDTINFEFIQ